MTQKYRDIIELGRGGMATVFLTFMTGPSGFQKLQVVKRLRPEFSEDVDFLRMFLDEARLAARINHPNVVQTNEVGVENGSHFIAMEFLEGQALATVLKRAKKRDAKFERALQIKILCETLTGLHFAHDLKSFEGEPLNIVHRDVSPQNIFVTYDGHVKLVDFGIAKASDSQNETSAGVIKGKISYMAPEQMLRMSNKIDRRADIFPMGIMLWHAITGQRLWQSKTDVEIFQHFAEASPMPKPSESDPVEEVDEDLEAICMKALAINPDDRYATAKEMCLALEAYLESRNLRPSSRDIAAFMDSLFADSREEVTLAIESQVRKAAELSLAGASIPQLNTLVPDAIPSSLSSGTLASQSSSELRSHLGGSTGGQAIGATATLPAPRAGRSKTPVIVSAVAAGVGILLIGVLAATRTHSTTPSGEGAIPPGIANTEISPKPPSTGLSAEGAMTELLIAISPPDARVWVDEIPVPNFAGRVSRKYPKDEAQHLIRAQAPGHVEHTQSVRFTGDTVQLTVSMVPTAKAPKGVAALPPVQGKAPIAAPAPSVAAPQPAASTEKPKKNAPQIDTTSPW